MYLVVPTDAYNVSVTRCYLLCSAAEPIHTISHWYVLVESQSNIRYLFSKSVRHRLSAVRGVSVRASLHILSVWCHWDDVKLPLSTQWLVYQKMFVADCVSYHHRGSCSAPPSSCRDIAVGYEEWQHDPGIWLINARLLAAVCNGSNLVIHRPRIAVF